MTRSFSFNAKRLVMNHHSLTHTFYYGVTKMLVAVDCIIFGFDGQKLKLLLFKRKVDPYAGQWSLVGSFVKENEGLEEAAVRTLHELSGLENVYMQQLFAFGGIDRDPGARVLSVSYYALIRLEGLDEEQVKEHNAKWFTLDKMPELIFDHQQMVNQALDALRKQTRYQPIGFELLPPKFTMPQLLKLYEEIYQKKLDDRNFRKKIKALNFLKQLDEKDKSNSKKGAFYYSFDKKKYARLLEKGVNVDLK